MIVLDASAAVDLPLRTGPGQRIEKRIYSLGESLHAPHLLDLEVAHVLWRFVREKSVSLHRADQAIEDLRDLRLTRYPHILFLAQIWGLRHNFSAYDAAYLALADGLEATLLTRDAALASASGPRVKVESF